MRDSFIERNIDSDYIDGLTPQDDGLSQILGQQMSRFDIPRHSQMRTNVDWAIGYISSLNLVASVLPVKNYPIENKDSVMDEADYRRWQIKATWDANKFKTHIDKIIADACISGEGIGRVEVARSGRSDILSSRLKWRNWRGVWYDSQSEMDDFKDARYLFDLQWQDIDIVSAYHNIPHGDIEMYSRVPELDRNRDESLILMSNDSYDNISSGFTGDERKQVLYGQVWYRDFKERKVKYAPIVVSRDLSEIKFLKAPSSPYEHNSIPYVRLVADRYKKDGLPYSPLTRLRRGQERFMQYPFRAIIELASGRKAIASVDCIPKDENGIPLFSPDEWAKVAKDWLNSPNGILFKRSGLQEDDFQILNNDAVLKNMIDLFTILSQSSEKSGMPIDPGLLGQSTNIHAAVALQEKAKQAHLSLNRLTNNYSNLVEEVGELTLCHIIQYGEAMEFVSPMREDGTVEDEVDKPEGTMSQVRMKYRITTKNRESGFETEQLKMITEMIKVVPEKLQPAILYIANSIVPFGNSGAMKDLAKMLLKEGIDLPDSMLDNQMRKEKKQMAEGQAQQQQEAAEFQKRAAEAEIEEKETKSDEQAAKAILARAKALQN